MKKIAILLLFAASIVTTATKAQSGAFNGPWAGGKGFPTTDTLTVTSATATKSYNAKIVGPQKLITAQIDFAAISGTINGWITYGGSIDTGRTYKTLFTDTLKSGISTYGHTWYSNDYNSMQVQVNYPSSTQSNSFTVWRFNRP